MILARAAVKSELLPVWSHSSIDGDAFAVHGNSVKVKGNVGGSIEANSIEVGGNVQGDIDANSVKVKGRHTGSINV